MKNLSVDLQSPNLYSSVNSSFKKDQPAEFGHIVMNWLLDDLKDFPHFKFSPLIRFDLD